jgi:hypothetical protein
LKFANQGLWSDFRVALFTSHVEQLPAYNREVKLELKRSCAGDLLSASRSAGGQAYRALSVLIAVYTIWTWHIQ